MRRLRKKRRKKPGPAQMSRMPYQIISDVTVITFPPSEQPQQMGYVRRMKNR